MFVREGEVRVICVREREDVCNLCMCVCERGCVQFVCGGRGDVCVYYVKERMCVCVCVLPARKDVCVVYVCI